jgi:hypothetical protein
MRVTVNFSWRYLGIGGYVDRQLDILRIYPLPFTRVSIISKYADYRSPDGRAR